MARTLLCLFAHPDDEATVGPLLAQSAGEGDTIVVVSATPGQMGLTPNHDLAAGEKLAAARVAELERACQYLGIRPPVVLPFLDGSIAGRAVVSEIVAEFHRLLAEWQPEDVITFGPEGASGHTDHRIVCAAATEAFQDPRTRARRLFYVAYPHSLLSGVRPAGEAEAKLKDALLSRLVDDRFIDTVVDCTAGLDAAERAIRCHRTQWSASLMDAWNRLNREWLRGRVYLRLAMRR